MIALVDFNNGRLRPIGREQIAIYEGGTYHYGASSDPDAVWIESVTDTHVTFRRYPYVTNQRERIEIFRHLAHTGTTTKLEQLKHYADTVSYGGDDVPDWLNNMIRHYTTVLNGQQSRTWDLDDIRMVKIRVRYIGNGDGWSEFERYYPSAVSGQDNSGMWPVLESYDFTASAAAELCHKINIGEMPGFEFVSVEERDE